MSEIYTDADLCWSDVDAERQHEMGGGFGAWPSLATTIGWLLFEAFGHVGARRVVAVQATPSATVMGRSYLRATVNGHNDHHAVLVVNVAARPVVADLVYYELEAQERFGYSGPDRAV